MSTKTTKWDVAEHLNSDEDVAAYLEAAFDDGDPRVVAHALGNVARAKGVASWRRIPVSPARVSTKPSIRMETHA